MWQLNVGNYSTQDVARKGALSLKVVDMHIQKKVEDNSISWDRPLPRENNKTAIPSSNNMFISRGNKWSRSYTNAMTRSNKDSNQAIPSTKEGVGVGGRVSVVEGKLFDMDLRKWTVGVVFEERAKQIKTDVRKNQGLQISPTFLNAHEQSCCRKTQRRQKPCLTTVFGTVMFGTHQLHHELVFLVSPLPDHSTKVSQSIDFFHRLSPNWDFACKTRTEGHTIDVSSWIVLLK